MDDKACVLVRSDCALFGRDPHTAVNPRGRVAVRGRCNGGYQRDRLPGEAARVGLRQIHAEWHLPPDTACLRRAAAS